MGVGGGGGGSTATQPYIKNMKSEFLVKTASCISQVPLIISPPIWGIKIDSDQNMFTKTQKHCYRSYYIKFKHSIVLKEQSLRETQLWSSFCPCKQKGN